MTPKNGDTVEIYGHLYEVTRETPDAHQTIGVTPVAGNPYAARDIDRRMLVSPVDGHWEIAP